MRSYRLALLALMLPAVVCAQTGAATIVLKTTLRNAPDGRELATLEPGAVVQLVAFKNDWTQATLEGWLHVSVVGPKRDAFPVSVKSPNGALMRATADRTGAVVALVEDGMGLEQVERTEQWVRVRRTGWLPTKVVKPGVSAVANVPKPPPAPRPQPPRPAPATPTVLAPPPPAPAPAAAAADSLPGDVAVARRTAILAAPTGRALGSLDSATRLVTGVSERGWVRVTLEGWVREADLVPLDSAPISAISAADLRTDPDRYKGRTVRWLVQVIAFQNADPLRKGLNPDEAYLLARGPGSESALLYLALPPSLIELGRQLKPLSTVVILARVRSGRSEPSGVPILDVQRIIQR